MKKKSTIIQWCAAGFFLLSLTVTGFHWTSLLVIIAAVLMMPLAAVQNVLAKGNIKRWIAVTAAGVLFFIAIVSQPSAPAPQSDPTDGNPAVTTANTDSTTTTVSTTTTSTTSTKPTTTAKPTTVTTTSANTTAKPTTVTTTSTTTTAKPTTVTTTTTTAKPTTVTTTTTTQRETTYVLNTNTHKIHHSDCSYVKAIKAENYQEYQGLLDVLIAQDYEYCKSCF